MSDKVYHCRYDIQPECGEFKREGADGKGLADAFIFVSILREGERAHDGSTAIFSFDGQNDGEEVPDTELFHTWALMASTLMNKPDCRPWQREIAKQTFEAVREKITGMKMH